MLTLQVNEQEKTVTLIGGKDTEVAGANNVINVWKNATLSRNRNEYVVYEAGPKEQPQLIGRDLAVFPQQNTIVIYDYE